MDWTGLDWTGHLTVVRTKDGLGAEVQAGGGRRAEGESQRSEAKMKWTSRVVSRDRWPVSSLSRGRLWAL